MSSSEYFCELLLGPEILIGAQGGVVAVETVDEHLAVLVAVLRARRPRSACARRPRSTSRHPSRTKRLYPFPDVRCASIPDLSRRIVLSSPYPPQRLRDGTPQAWLRIAGPLASPPSPVQEPESPVHSCSPIYSATLPRRSLFCSSTPSIRPLDPDGLGSYLLLRLRAGVVGSGTAHGQERPHLHVVVQVDLAREARLLQ